MALKIIGSGVGRTGTLSTKYALEILGFEKCFHMFELFKDPSLVPLLETLRTDCKTDFDELFRGFQSTVDFPVCVFYKELFEAYPDAKVLHTVRDPERWYDSVMKTIYATKPKTLIQKIRMMFQMMNKPIMRKALPVFKFNDAVLWEGFFEGKIENKAWAIQKFKDHTEEVKAHIPAEQLLIFDVKQGWEPLCEFLDVPVPDVPYPRINQGSDFHSILQNFGKTGEMSEESKVQGLSK